MQTRSRLYIFNPCFYMMLSVLAGNIGAALGGEIFYSVLSAAIPYFVYVKTGGEKIKFDKTGRGLNIVLIAVFVWFCGNFLNSAVNAILEEIGINRVTQLEKAPDMLIYSFFSACVVAPVCEEIVYRGIILKSAAWLGNGVAVIISATLFAAAHGSVTVFVMPFICGAVCAMTAIKTGSILPAVIIHALCNTASFILIETGIDVTYITVAGGIISTGFLILFLIKNKTAVENSIIRFVKSIDLWWAAVGLEFLIMNILYHGG